MVILPEVREESGTQEERQEEPRSKYHPFDNELASKFYRNLPDFSEHVIYEEEAQELIKRERLESDDLVAKEIERLQSL